MENKLNPTLWRTARSLANPLRLSIIRELILNGEQCVDDIAASLGLQEGRASLELRTINARGMISVRRQGRWAFYRLEANESIAGNSALLNEIIKAMRTKRLSDKEMISVLTAFTHERRIYLVRMLAGGALSYAEIGVKTGYSNPSLSRHLRKLRRRGIITLRENTYSLLPQSDPFTSVLVRLAVLSET